MKEIFYTMWREWQQPEEHGEQTSNKKAGTTSKAAEGPVHITIGPEKARRHKPCRWTKVLKVFEMKNTDGLSFCPNLVYNKSC
jgi:hypothetical protein